MTKHRQGDPVAFLLGLVIFAAGAVIFWIALRPDAPTGFANAVIRLVAALTAYGGFAVFALRDASPAAKQPRQVRYCLVVVLLTYAAAVYYGSSLSVFFGLLITALAVAAVEMAKARGRLSVMG